MRWCNVLFPLLLLCIVSPALAQQDSSTYSRLYNLPDKLFNNISKKSRQLEQKLDKQTDKYLARLEKQERKLQAKLRKTDSLKAATLFGDIDKHYANVRNQAKALGQPSDLNGYSAHLDSLGTTLKFIQQERGLHDTGGGKLQDALNGCTQLQDKMNNAERIKQLIAERRAYLKQQLANTGLARQFDKYQRQVYYYRAQVDEYKKMLSDPSKLEARLLQAARKIPAFHNFFQKHSQLASIFNVPDNYANNVASLQGLQTRGGVQAMLQQRLSAGGPGAQQAMQQQVAAAQEQLQQLKNKISKIGNNGGDIEMPDFKPNDQRTKSFLQRLEFGVNVQSQKSRYYFPATSDLGLSVGYKLNNAGIIGLGVNYKLGLGNGWNNIKITHEGIGMRTFLDWKLKGNFYASGGYERQHRTAFNRVEQLNNLNAWQSSALLGVSRKYSIGKKIKGNVQLLYDFLHASQTPETQPVVFRLGYNF